MRGSKDLARVESLTKSGIGGGVGGERIMRVRESDRKKMRMETSVVALVAVMASSLDLKRFDKRDERLAVLYFGTDGEADVWSGQSVYMLKAAKMEVKYNYWDFPRHQTQARGKTIWREFWLWGSLFYWRVCASW